MLSWYVLSFWRYLVRKFRNNNPKHVIILSGEDVRITFLKMAMEDGNRVEVGMEKILRRFTQCLKKEAAYFQRL